MTEIVAPAGNFSKLQTAILYGADAVYFSGEKYGLRMGADNFSWDEIAKGVAECHQNSCKAYITLNSYFHDQDFESFLEYLNYLSALKVDAVICSDLGVVHFVKQKTKIPVHLSTQAFVLNSWHAKVWKKMGVKRIVLGRELSLLQAAKIKKEVGIEVELFVHGAMCMSYSGHCTISNYTAGRDSNRGGCIQSCRHIYNIQGSQQQETLLSSKDLNASSYFQQFIDYGINAAKIEGRMKSELYLAATVRAYSNLKTELQTKSTSNINWLADLEKIPHRGYTSGSLKQKAQADSIYDGTGSSNSQVKFLGIVIFYDSEKNKIFLHCKNPFRENDKIEILGAQENFFIIVKDLRNAANEKITLTKPDSMVSFYSGEHSLFDFSNGLLVRDLQSTSTFQKVV